VSMKSREDCAVCGAALVYGSQARSLPCVFCAREASTLIYCPNGHYVCDACHRLDAVAALKALLASSTSTSPHELLEGVMAHPSAPMHGPEHHVFMPAVLVAAARNAGYQAPANALDEAIRRGSLVPGGWCGYHGACGAGVGVGIAVSVLSGATPLRGPQRGLALQATSRALARIADDSPRCCKRASRRALDVALEFLDERLGIALPRAKPARCANTARNSECPRQRCEFYYLVP